MELAWIKSSFDDSYNKSVQKLNKREEDFLGKIIRVIKTTIYIKRRQKEINKGILARTLIGCVIKKLMAKHREIK